MFFEAGFERPDHVRHGHHHPAVRKADIGFLVRTGEQIEEIRHLKLDRAGDVRPALRLRLPPVVMLPLAPFRRVKIAIDVNERALPIGFRLPAACAESSSASVISQDTTSP